MLLAIGVNDVEKLMLLELTCTSLGSDLVDICSAERVSDEQYAVGMPVFFAVFGLNHACETTAASVTSINVGKCRGCQEGELPPCEEAW